MGGAEWGLVKGLGVGALSMWNPYAGAAAAAVLAAEENRRKKADSQRSLDARAEAIKYSYGRKDGTGTIPEARYFNGSDAGAALAGGVSGYMQGKAFEKAQAPAASTNDYGMTPPTLQAGGMFSSDPGGSVDYGSLYSGQGANYYNDQLESLFGAPKRSSYSNLAWTQP